MAYRSVLTALDLSDECEQVVERARGVVGAEGRVLLMHVVAPLPMTYGADLLMEQPVLQEEQLDVAREHLLRLASRVGVAADACFTGFGDARHEIHRVAVEQGADLIVVGSHGRHGLALLLGSTANGVLHGAPCDVLAVRLG